MSYYRLNDTVRTPLGVGVPGASIAVLTQPANTCNQPGTPLATIYSASVSNSATVTGASWSNGFINFTLNFVPADVVANSFISVSGVAPTGYNGIWQVASVVGLVVSVETPYGTSAPNPGAWVSGGAVATSALPNPFQTDGLGNWYFYASPNVYTVQIYDTLNRILPQVFPDQSVLAPGAGTVTSVAMTGDGTIFNATVSGSPVTTSGTLAPALLTQAAGTILAGPSSGPNAAPTFVTASTYLAGLGLGSGTVTSVAASVTAGTLFTASFSGTPVTTSGTLALSIDFANQNANLVLASPTTGSAGPITARSLVGADLPAPTTSAFGGIVAVSGATAHEWVTYIDTSGVQHFSQPNFTDLAGSIAGSQIPSSTVTVAMLSSVEGNGTKVQLTSAGTTVSGDVVTYDGSGNVQDSGTLLSSLAPLASPVFSGHLDTSSADIAGTATITNPATTAAVTFASNFTGTNAPVVVVTAVGANPAALGGVWVTNTGSSGAWTGFTINVMTTPSSSATFNYHVIGS